MIGHVGQGGRRPVHTDAVEAFIVSGDLGVPQAEDAIDMPDGTTRAWGVIDADDNGWMTHAALRGGYASAEVNATSDGIVVLEAQGHRTAYMNGEPRVGDPYSTGWLMLPVALQEGANHLLFAVGRGRLRAQLSEPPASAFLNLRDQTLPDIIAGDTSQVVAGIIVVNATNEWRDALQVWTSGEAVDTAVTPVDPIPPLSFRKVPVMVRPRDTSSLDTVELRLRLIDLSNPDAALHEGATALRIRQPGQAHKTTFISDIDGSVQYYATVPARVPPEVETDGPPPGLVLTLHGASVEGIGQAGSYAAKPWCHIVAPTNRRPYGFDWEDWGRLGRDGSARPGD